MPAMPFNLFSRRQHADKLMHALRLTPAPIVVATIPTIKRHYAEPVVRARRRHCSRFL